MSDVDVYNAEEGDRPVEKSPRGRYIRFDIRLGTGAYKSVYKAYDTDQGIDVAWNAIDIGVLPASEKTRIIQEVQLLQKLEHKNIINFYGSWFSKEKNQVVFITEIMTSGTLKSYIKRVQFVKWKIIKRWCVQILEGLMYLHGQNPPVIHRDLKCDNIFINGNTGDLRIGDLGLSTQLAVQKSRAQSVLGTPEFMAPELYDESYDEKVDIYAFGMCVLEMVTKEVPYSECVNPAQIYKKVTSGIRPRGMQRIVSEAARDFIELCLSRGDGKIDVSAAYLLNHPFLKPSEEDNRMVKVLTDEELQQREVAIAAPAPPAALPDMSPRKFAAELNMESAAKVSVTRKDSAIESASNENQVEQKPLHPEPEALSTAAAPHPTTNTTQPAIRAEEKTSGQHYIVPTKAAVQSDASAGVVATQPPPSVLPPLPPVITEAVEPVVDEPLSGQKDVDNHVEAFLSTMAGNEASIDNSRIALMGGRGHRIEINDNEQPVDKEDEKQEPPAPVAPPPAAPTTSVPPATVEPAAARMTQPAVQAPADVSPPVSRPASAPRIRAKRYEIRSSNDPTNSRSILLNLRIAIDGKSKEIKFPFNFFTESPHEVACELAVDVGILEPDLEDITDSISFLVTESKINNLPDLDQDIWDEAPEPHSFSSKPLPSVSKMTFIGQQVVSVTTQLPSESPAQQPAGLASALPLMRSGAPTAVVQQDVATPLVALSLMPPGLREPAGPIPGAPSLERGVSALERGVAVQPPRIPRAQSELFQPDDYLSVLTEQERGAALGTSASDPNFLLHAVRNLDDRLKATKTSFGEQETLMEEKYQSEIERLRNMMSQLSEKTQRATLARYAREHMLTDDLTGDTISMERLTAFSEDNAGLRSSPMQQQVPSAVSANGVLDANALPPSLGVRRYPSADPRLEAPPSPSHAADALVTELPTATEPPPVATTTAEATQSEPLEPAQ